MSCKKQNMEFWERHSYSYDEQVTTNTWFTFTYTLNTCLLSEKNMTQKKADKFCKDQLKVTVVPDANGRPKIDSFIVFYYDESGIKHEPK